MEDTLPVAKTTVHLGGGEGAEVEMCFAVSTSGMLEEGSSLREWSGGCMECAAGNGGGTG